MMKLKTLSEAQLALIPQVRDEWIGICLDTTPVNPAKVREILAQLYSIVGKPAPKNIIHLDSPLQVSNAIAKLHLASDQVLEEVFNQVQKNAEREINSRACKHISKKILRQIVTQVREPVHDPVIGELIGQVQKKTRVPFSPILGGGTSWQLRTYFGQFDYWLSSYDFLGRLGFDVSPLMPAFEMAKSCGWSVLFWDCAYISAKPEFVHRDEQGRLHCNTGAAIRYPDGFSVFAIHGVRVPENRFRALAPNLNRQ